MFCFSDDPECVPQDNLVLRSTIEPIPLNSIYIKLGDTGSEFTKRFMVSLAMIANRQLALFQNLHTQLERDKETFYARFREATGLDWKESSDAQKEHHIENHSALVSKIGAVEAIIRTLREMDVPPDMSRYRPTSRTRTAFAAAFEERRTGLMRVISEIEKLIGMHSIKNNIAAIIVQYVYDPASAGQNHLNIALGGPPGTGKSTIALMLMKVYYNLGVLPKPVPPDALAKRNGGDLVSAFEGGTAGKTNQFMTDILGSVGFLDEAYSLAARHDGRASYGKIAIDTIVSALDVYMGITCLIVAGYARELEESFFKANIGMPRRFPMRWETEEFTGEQLYCILVTMLADRNVAFTPEGCSSAMSLIQRAHELGIFRRSNAGGIKTVVDLCIRTDTVMQYHQGGGTDPLTGAVERHIQPSVFRNALALYIQSMLHKDAVFYETDPAKAASKRSQEGIDPSEGDVMMEDPAPRRLRRKRQ